MTNRSTTAEPTQAGGRLSCTQASILALLHNRPVARSAREIAEVIGRRKPAVSEAIKSLRRRGLVEQVGAGHETRYQRPGAVAAPPGPAVLVGDRPRRLGLRAAWLRQHPPGAEPIDEPEPSEATG